MIMVISSGPNLDDHLAYRSHDSGHMGLSDSPTGSALGKEEKKESELQRHEKEIDTGTSSGHFVRVSDQVPRIAPAQYEYVRGDPSSGVPFCIGGEDTSIDTQSTQQTTPPVVRPRSHSGGEKKLKQRNEGSLPGDTSTDTKHPHPPIPRPRSDNNLLSTRGPPNSPRRKPIAVPRKGSPRNNRSNESSTALSDVQTANKDISAEDENAATAVCTSQPLPEIHESLTVDDGPTACTSHVTSMESSSSDNNIHSEAHTSLESSSPGHSLESKPSVSDKPDPCSSTPPEKARSACSGERVIFEEASLGDWVKVDVSTSVNEKGSNDALISLDCQPRPRERVSAFSTNSDRTVSDKSQKPTKSTRNEAAYMYTTNPIVDIHTDIQKAKLAGTVQI